MARKAPNGATRAAVEGFLYREARLLDEGRLEEWGELFTDDGVYWVPAGEGRDYRSEPAIICDLPQQRAMRIHQIVQYNRLSQDPPSRLIHFLSNIEVEDGAGRDEVIVRCNALIHEVRPGDFQALQVGIGTPRAFAARCEYRLRPGADWRIAEKKILLLNRDQPLHNLTCII